MLNPHRYTCRQEWKINEVKKTYHIVLAALSAKDPSEAAEKYYEEFLKTIQH
jgi:hypothetical protein